MTNTQELGPDAQTPELLDRLARIREAVGTIAGSAESVVANEDDSQSTILAIKAGRITTAIELVGDNTFDLDGETADEATTDTTKYQLSEQQWAMVAESLPLIDFVTNRFFYNLPQSVDKDDVTSAGIWGLIDATSRYSEEYGYTFSTYALHRIRGAMLDHLRSIDRVPRSVRRTVKLIGEAEQTLASRTGQAPTDREIAEELGLPLIIVTKAREEEGKLGSVSLEQEVIGDGANGGITIDMVLAADNGDSALDAVETREEQDLVRAAISKLTEQQRLVIKAYYYDQKSLLEIGSDMGFTESRACQIKTTATKRLRTLMEAQYRDRT